MASARLPAVGPCLLHAGRSSDGTDVALRSTADERLRGAMACIMTHAQQSTEVDGLCVGQHRP